MNSYVKLLLVVLLLGGFIPILINSCGSDQQVKKEVSQIGSDAATELVTNLKSELVQAMKEGGPVNAVDYCNTQAIPLTDSVQQILESGITIKRTSIKYRNPANAPGNLEREVITELEKMVSEGEQLPEHIVRKEGNGMGKTYHYFKPMTVGTTCLNCHGKTSEMSEELVQLLEERYPNDRATGYSEGDFRGVIHVSIPQQVVQE